MGRSGLIWPGSLSPCWRQSGRTASWLLPPARVARRLPRINLRRLTSAGGQAIRMRRVPEFLMYLAFSAAALAPALLGLRTLFYYRAHPEMLEVRDAAVEVLAVVGAAQVMGVCLLVAVLSALYVLIVGPRAARINIIILLVA